MARFSALNPVARIVLVALAGIILVAAGYALWLVAGPGPMDFASGPAGVFVAGQPGGDEPFRGAGGVSRRGPRGAR